MVYPLVLQVHLGLEPHLVLRQHPQHVHRGALQRRGRLDAGGQLGHGLLPAVLLELGRGREAMGHERQRERVDELVHRAER